MYYGDRPQTEPRPYIQFSIQEQVSSVGTGRISIMRLFVAIGGVERLSGDETDFGFDKLLLIKEAVRDRFIAWKPAVAGGITYTALSGVEVVEGARGPTGENLSEVGVFTLVASEGLTGGLLTGQSLLIAGTLASGAGGIATTHPFQVRVIQRQAQEQRIPYTERVAEYMTSDRNALAVIGFYGQGGVVPRIPTGVYSTFTITLDTGATYSGAANVSEMNVGSSQEGGIVRGSYQVLFSGNMSTGYGTE